MTPHRSTQPLPALPSPTMVAKPEQLTGFRKAIQGSLRLAVDTESNSLHTYREQVCLIQVSTDQADFLIDPLQLRRKSDLDFFGDVLANPKIEKVLHAAEYDVMVLKRDFGFTFAGIFDTMLATRILGRKHTGLGAALEEHFGVHVNKANQRANWGRRPLPANLIQYAQLDTHFLLPLRDRLHSELARIGALEEAYEIFGEVSSAEWNGGHFNPDGYWLLRGVRSLAPTALAILRELYLYRDDQARQHDLPVFKVMSDSILVTLASLAPRSIDEMYQHKVPGQHIQQYGTGILACVQRGLQSSPPTPPHKRNNHYNDLVLHRFEALHAWRKKRAEQRGVPSDIIMPKDVLWELAEVAPRTDQQLAAIHTLGPWRLKTYGDELLHILTTVDDAQAANQ
ncbi:MAG: HRDC domain-containing protein [Anaerolineae bacterium]|nr:HRDC domain-containing protein [Anaerolineae bacterium]